MVEFRSLMNWNSIFSPRVIISNWKWFIGLLVIIILILGLAGGIHTLQKKCECFTNKAYDPYGAGIRFFQSRDDTGSPQTTLEDRQVNGEKLIVEPLTVEPLTVEPLTGTRESPNFSEYYGIDVNLKNGRVMIERENFENSSLSADELIKANKGL